MLKIGISISAEELSTARPHKGKSLIKFPKDYVILDLETTGLSPEIDDIIEIAALKYKNNELQEVFTSLIKPRTPVSDFIANLTGITNEMLGIAPTIEQVLPQALAFIGDYFIIGYNVNFDINFLYDASMRYLQQPMSNNFLDVLRLARKLLKELPSRRMSSVCDYFGIPADGHHRAEKDCLLTNECYRELYKLGISTYGGEEELQAAFAKNKHYPPRINVNNITPQTAIFDELHPLFGMTCVFTGELDRLTRRDAMQLVVNCGGNCSNNITKKTNILIIGDTEYTNLIKDGKTGKIKKAEEYISKGIDIEMMPEFVFYDLVFSNEECELDEREDDSTGNYKLFAADVMSGES